MHELSNLLPEAKVMAIRIANAFHSSIIQILLPNATASSMKAIFDSPRFLRCLENVTFSYWGQVFGILILFYVCLRVVYRLYFHPLSKFPGPKLAAITPLYRSYMLWSGYYYLHSERLHKNYGPAVRFAPDEISFSSPAAYKTIHDAKQRFNKGPKYASTNGMSTKSVPASIAGERDPAEHYRKKKRVQNAFSFRALSEQENLISHWIDLLVNRLGENGEGGNKALNVVEWYNMATFDIIGDLAFGESFCSLTSGKQHFWVEVLFNHTKLSVFFQILSDFPWIEYLVKRFLTFMMPRNLAEARKKNMQYSMDKIRKRMDMKTSRKDFMSHILANEQDPAIHDIRYLAIEASLFASAGSETTASFLSATTWLLCKNPRAYSKLVSEIRNTFSSYDQINNESTAHLSYLNAVIEEGLRYLPPAAMVLSRVCPGGMIDGFYVPTGKIVYVCMRTMTRSEKYWAHPNEFWPERWLPKNHLYFSHEFDKDDHDASQPFGLGPRACLGRNLAYMEMRLILSKILWMYDLQLGKRVHDQIWLENGRLKQYLLWERPELLVRFIPIR